MIDAGRLRHRITFQRFDGTVDSNGDPQTQNDANWDNVCSVCAAVEPLKGREFYFAEQSQSEVTHKITIRYKSGLTSAMRILFGQRKFHVISIIDWEERHETLRLMCTEQVDT